MTNFDAAFDMPNTPEEALAVLEAWSSPSCATFSDKRAQRIFELLNQVINHEHGNNTR